MQHYNNKKYFKVDLTMVPNPMLLASRCLIECEEELGKKKGVVVVVEGSTRFSLAWIQKIIP
jgi:hypothetical protein